MAKESSKKSLIIRLVAFLIIAAIFGVSIAFEDKINVALGFTSPPESERPASSDGAAALDEGELYVHFLNVGQGDSCIVELPDDKTLLIDGANNGYDDEIIGYIRDNIRTDDGKVIEYFDYAILTHTDSDHCASMDEVLEEFPAKVFYRPNVLCNAAGYTDPGADDLYGNPRSKDTKAYRNVLEAAYAYEGVEVRVNSNELDPIVPEGVAEGAPGWYSLSFYGPCSDRYEDDWNDYSPIMVLEFAGERFVLTGDCEKKGEAEFCDLVNKGEGKYSVFDDDYTVSVIKLGHHGSRTSTGRKFVDAITTPQSCPDIMLVVSCAADSQYGHPHKDKIDQLLDQGFKEENILKTFESDPAIVFSVRYDEQSNDMRLFFGDNAIVIDTSAPKESFIEWRYIALAVIAAAALLLIVIPACPAIVKKLKVK